MIGRTVSHYKILKKIGEGGMGTVYLSEDVKLGRKVALKILTKHLTERDGSRERFKREARAAAILNHPNIVTVHEIDEHEDLIYIVMEYLEGETLDRKIKVKGEEEGDKTTPLEILKIDKIIDILLEICNGLSAAHQAGIVHRDIKLENIMISPDGSVKILDFGLAKLKGASKLTADSIALGTAFYMSPEQLKGETFDHRIDIWSLGIMMYLMTTGELPFAGDTPMEIIYSIMKTEPEPIIKHNKKVPPGLRRIVNRCLKKNPDKRYQDVSSIMADLAQVRESVITGKNNFKWKAISMVDAFRGNFSRIALPLSAAAVLLLILLSIPSSSLKIRKFLGFNILPSHKYLAILPIGNSGEKTTEHSAFGAGLTENLTRKLILLEPFKKNLLVIPSRKMKGYNVKTIQDARQSLGVNLVVQSTIYWKNNRIRLTVNIVEAKKERILYSWETTKHKSELIDFRNEIMENIARMLEVRLGPEMKTLLLTGCTSLPGAYDKFLKARGYLVDSRGTEDIGRSVELFNRAIQIDTDYELAYTGLAEAYYRKYLLTKESKWAKKALNFFLSAKEKEPRLACNYIILGKLYKETKQYPEALRAFARVLNIDSVNGEALRETAKVYEAQTNLVKAEKTYIEATRKRPIDFAAFNNLGYFYYQKGRLQDAVKAFEEGVRVNPGYFKGLLNLGGLYFYLERWKDAREMFERSLLIKQTYSAFSNLGTLYYYQGLYEMAIDRFKRALELNTKNFRIFGFLAESYYQTGDNEKAVANFKQAIKQAKRVLEEKADDPDVLSYLASYYVRIGDHDSTLSILNKLTEKAIHNPKIMFRIACAFEQTGQRDPALAWIKAALKKGLPLVKIDSNPELSGLRSDRRFREFLHTIKTKSKGEKNR